MAAMAMVPQQTSSTTTAPVLARSTEKELSDDAGLKVKAISIPVLSSLFSDQQRCAQGCELHRSDHSVVQALTCLNTRMSYICMRNTMNGPKRQAQTQLLHSCIYCVRVFYNGDGAVKAARTLQKGASLRKQPLVRVCISSRRNVSQAIAIMHVARHMYSPAHSPGEGSS